MKTNERKGKTAFQVATEAMFSKNPAFSASTDGQTIRIAMLAATFDRAVVRAGVSSAHQKSFGGAIHKPYNVRWTRNKRT